MKKYVIFGQIILLLFFAFLLPGCGARTGEPESSEEQQVQKTAGARPDTIETDWSGCFDGLSGAAVLFNPAEKQCLVYNEQTAGERRSPCSTFKIISSLIGLEKGILIPEHSTRVWSGEVFWNEEWNQDLDFKGAFQSSCVWYFRELVDEIGKDAIQEELKELHYGNCDISDWQGSLNTNNDNPALTGFWIESSLKISAQEQVWVLERIFGKQSPYARKTKDALKDVMLISEQSLKGYRVYGKTGMGKDRGLVVDAWFTGLAENRKKSETLYFCVYLGETAGKNADQTKSE